MKPYLACILLVSTLLTLVVSCNNPPQPRPFAGRGGRNLDQPPRYGDNNRYLTPSQSASAPAANLPGGTTTPSVTDPSAAAIVTPKIDPVTIPTTPEAPTGLPGAAGVDQGLAVKPPTVNTAPTVTPQVTAPGTTTPPAVTTVPTPTIRPAVSDVPFARAVPGKPGFVYSPKNPEKVISVEGLSPGQKAQDPDTKEIFRVPY